MISARLAEPFERREYLTKTGMSDPRRLHDRSGIHAAALADPEPAPYAGRLGHDTRHPTGAWSFCRALGLSQRNLRRGFTFRPARSDWAQGRKPRRPPTCLSAGARTQPCGRDRSAASTPDLGLRAGHHGRPELRAGEDVICHRSASPLVIFSLLEPPCERNIHNSRRAPKCGLATHTIPFRKNNRHSSRVGMFSHVGGGTEGPIP